MEACTISSPVLTVSLEYETQQNLDYTKQAFPQ